ncbi:hypothetical protein BRC64_10730 [Halobacteriales archaeon QH_10_67_22]|nr:MAG: hypothetical protein BRC64_10730 [Halobacteriales archaeon QH_10_67_22]
MLLALMPAWGYSTAASTLVGQAIGAGDDDGATDYGWQTLRIALATQLLIAAVLVLGARPIAVAFGTDTVDLTVTFIRVFGVAVAGFSVSRAMRGSLRGAGDTRWPMYGTLLGSFGVRLPVAALSLPAGFAVTVLGTSLPVGMGLGLPAAVEPGSVVVAESPVQRPRTEGGERPDDPEAGAVAARRLVGLGRRRPAGHRRRGRSRRLRLAGSRRLRRGFGRGRGRCLRRSRRLVRRAAVLDEPGVFRFSLRTPSGRGRPGGDDAAVARLDDVGKLVPPTG